MKNLTATSGLPALIGLTTLAVVLWLAPVAQARTYPDVPKSSWAYAAINWVTNQGPVPSCSMTTPGRSSRRRSR